ncbi:hypothetical protein HYDPIDRAFT_111217 [Hydnomerulius pinastri MD-312]|uniref:F-box domain-containing protein n=1 Tax=Hydnomerulius pinastri MD-312 TaxID=994086 RepID=A0A0C9WGE6_9AGAM|nr:hypothetical protein HYDPIDRAFT_111217 [Hydnomerulius pinastri MD-312]
MRWSSTLNEPSALAALDLTAIDQPPFQSHPTSFTFQPLLRLANPRELNLDGLCELPFDNEILRRMGEAFPYLEILSLNYDAG